MTPTERRAESRQIATEARDYAYDVLVGIVLALLLLGAVWGHSAVSVAYGQAEQMPELRTDLMLPYVAR